MSGTQLGGIRAAQTNRKRYGYNFYAYIGKKGGKAKVPKGFAMNRELASIAGSIGGKISKRGPTGVEG